MKRQRKRERERKRGGKKEEGRGRKIKVTLMKKCLINDLIEKIPLPNNIPIFLTFILAFIAILNFQRS